MLVQLENECNNGNGEADTNSNAGLSFGGEDSFQNDDIMLSYSSPGNFSVGVYDNKRRRHFSRLSPVNSEVLEGDNESFDDNDIYLT